MAKLRHTETILFGSTEMMVESTALVLARIKKGNPGYLAVTNFGSEAVTMDIKMAHMPERGTLTLISSPGDAELEGFMKGSSISLSQFTIQGHTSILITFVPNFG